MFDKIERKTRKTQGGCKASDTFFLICQRDANEMSTSRQRDLIGFVEQYWNKCQLDNDHFSLRGLTHFFNFSKRYQRHINEPSPRSRWSHSTLLEQFSTRQRALLVEGVDTFFSLVRDMPTKFNECPRASTRSPCLSVRVLELTGQD